MTTRPNASHTAVSMIANILMDEFPERFMSEAECVDQSEDREVAWSSSHVMRLTTENKKYPAYFVYTRQGEHEAGPLMGCSIERAVEITKPKFGWTSWSRC